MTQTLESDRDTAERQRDQPSFLAANCFAFSLFFCACLFSQAFSLISLLVLLPLNTGIMSLSMLSNIASSSASSSSSNLIFSCAIFLWLTARCLPSSLNLNPSESERSFFVFAVGEKGSFVLSTSPPFGESPPPPRSLELMALTSPSALSADALSPLEVRGALLMLSPIFFGAGRLDPRGARCVGRLCVSPLPRGVVEPCDLGFGPFDISSPLEVARLIPRPGEAPPLSGLA
eukprot:CAMPEP_0114136582 /NCGR_PEP_ID=MMETSP0043_2-20121206/15314_1 /TAXON_ID=464988 /ORGANISM="Hemiselmis andersenii, Strain CCMP644" /LENGTH=231 /DNA_ID=CAMNT_0001230391 /DNA_START=30 /DNA_END=725 /DNA_ORIENTATION=+